MRKIIFGFLLLFNMISVAEAQSLDQSKGLETTILGPAQDGTSNSKQDLFVVINPDVLANAKNAMFVVLVQSSNARSFRSPLIQAR